MVSLKIMLETGEQKNSLTKPRNRINATRAMKTFSLPRDEQRQPTKTIQRMTQRCDTTKNVKEPNTYESQRCGEWKMCLNSGSKALSQRSKMPRCVSLLGSLERWW